MANKKVTPLMDTEIKKLKPKTDKNKGYTISDGNGLQLLINLNGRKIWEIRYTINGKAKKTTLGTIESFVRKREDGTCCCQSPIY